MEVRRSVGLAGACLILLGWALDGGVATKDAAVSWPGLEQGFAADTLVKIQTGIGGHDFLALMPAGGASEGGLTL